MESRSKKSAMNIITGLGGRVVLLLLAFYVKTIFIRLLGAEYNGINGLYSNILTVLSLADLGVGNVFTYSLYKALKEKDESQIAALVYSFRKIYRLIAFFVLGAGLLLVPILKYIINSSLPAEELITYYLLYLLNSIVSYFVAYRTTVIIADQKKYVVNICNTGFVFLCYLLQIMYLYFIRNFLGYLIIQVLCTLGTNLALNMIAGRMYPFLSEKSLVKQKKLPPKIIGENIKSTFIYKMSIVLINNTDNILISILLGTVNVGYYLNYHLLTEYVSKYVSFLCVELLASLGNLNAENDADKSYNIFNTLGLIYAIIANYCICTFAACIQIFIPIWIGEQYMLDNLTVAAILLLLYISISSSPVWMFRETMGLFKEVKYIMLSTVIINFILSIILGKIMGLPGIIFATSIAILSTHYWYEPLILFRKKFKSRPLFYFYTQGKYLLCTMSSLAVTMLAGRMLPANLPFLLLRVLVCGGIVLFFEMIFNRKSLALKRIIAKCKCLLPFNH